MLTTQTIKDIRSEAREIIERYYACLRELNTMFMAAWRNGTLDAEWAEYRQDNPEHYLTYYIRARGMGDIKIGKSNQIGVRIRNLWTSASRGLDLVACYPSDMGHETEVQAEFEKLRLCGEWFRPGPDLLIHLRLIGCDTSAFTNSVPPHFYRRYPERLTMEHVNAVHSFRNRRK